MTGRRWIVTAVAAAAGVALDLVVGYSPFPGYALLLGLGGCAAIVVVSKWLGRHLLQRPETFYGDDAPAAHPAAPGSTAPDPPGPSHDREGAGG